MTMKYKDKTIIKTFLAFPLFLLASCSSDDVENDSYYTFTGETVAGFCENRPSTFSVFSAIVEGAGLESLLSVYGHYTAFIPTDSAFNVYFDETGQTLESLTKEDMKNIVYNHVIRSVTTNYLTTDFTEGAIATANMNNRYMVISYSLDEVAGNNEIYVNKSARIIHADVELHNGVVHVIDKVLVPSDETLGSVLSSLPAFSIFARALKLTHLNDSISESYDMSYVSPYSTEYTTVVGYTVKGLQQKQLGYTIFAEPDEVFSRAGITDMNELVAYAEIYYGTEDRGDYTSRNNALNKFVSYHILDRQMSTNSLIYSGACTSSSAVDKRYEYYETLLKYRLMEIKSGNMINTRSDGSCISLDEAESNISGLNGFIHCLDDILVYDEESMVNDVLAKRIRVDAYAIPPEFTNNNIRWQLVGIEDFSGYTIPPSYCGDYFTFNDDSKVILWASEYWTNHQADEISIRGWYDFTLRLPPVPPGSYEVRLGYRAETWRGIAQLFIDGDIVGIPVNLAYTGEEPQIGWIADDETTDGGDENDKTMRNRGYMKAPNSIWSLNGPKTLRDDVNSLRIIIGQFTWQEYAPHYFRAKNVEREDGEFHLDYIEIVPTSYIENEGKD